MNYLSVCSGIEAASVAWQELGWQPVGFSEIEPFPSVVLQHHYPDVPNFGDMNNFKEWDINETVNIVVGGTPCQSFSVAGGRGSLTDARGNLALTFCELCDYYNPELIIWENVPGVLNTKDNAFGCFLGELSGSGCELKPAGERWANAGCVSGPKRTIAWRVLDAQYFGLAQRRKRVFVIASARDRLNPTEILFEFNGLRRDTAPSREAREETTEDVGVGFTASSFGGYTKGVGTLRAAGGDLGGGSETVVAQVVHGTQDPIISADRAHPLGRNNGQENAVYAIQGSMIGRKPENGPQGSGYDDTGVCFTQTAADRHGVGGRFGVRKLTPIECERLQGFPEVTKRCILTFYNNNTIFDICFIDQLNINALADQSYRKSLSSVLIAEEKESKLPAKYVVQSLNVSRAELKKPALVNVRIDLERQLLQIHNQEKPLLSVKIADKKKWCPLPIQVEDFARLCVATLTALEREAQTGREVSQANTKSFTHQKSGKKFASLCGLEIGDHVKDVQKFTKKVTECMKCTTSEAGQSSRNSEQILQTLLYCVTTAINSFIQGKIHPKNSYVLSIEVTSGYTQVPWRGRPAEECPDGHRYKALGNSMAVPVMRWVGERISAYIKNKGKLK